MGKMAEIVQNLIERLGEPALLLIAGLIVGILFGAAAQHSRFCMRAATIEASALTLGPKMRVWIIAFAAAVAGTQGAIAAGWVDLSAARQLSATGSISGAVIGGLLFGVGMILARGCASRLLVLAASGNLRAIVTGLVLTLVAQASLRGVLSPARETLSQLWLVEGGPSRNVLTMLELSSSVAAALAAVVLAGTVVYALRRGEGNSRTIAAALVGLAVALGWIVTALIAQQSFEVVAVSSVTFTGPSADTLMGLINETRLPLSFASGLVPGVVLGAGLLAILSREFRIERFDASMPMERYLLGAVLMGFGSMLAGGCAVGATVSGGAIMALTAWVAGVSMWTGAVLTNLVLNRASLIQPSVAATNR